MFYVLSFNIMTRGEMRFFVVLPPIQVSQEKSSGGCVFCVLIVR